MQKKPLNTANRHTRANENTYDCTDVRTNHKGKPEGEKSIYQSLVTEEARARFKPEVNVATYQSLNPDGLMYQPLMLNKVFSRLLSFFATIWSNRQLVAVFVSSGQTETQVRGRKF